ncbi:MAG: nucleoside 2-deoxyribosyltransferase [Candidatus Gottesmanbacteria bacterium]|nr:nucleoside 2-deoxyribosyltransferase [Candidatus Gottesmanbacteria bacterium]
MNVYFTAATTGDGDLLSQEASIFAELKKLNVRITSGEQIIVPRKLIQDKERSPKEIFEREKKGIDAADCVIAEVTKPSSGVGGEIVYALMHHKPVLALFYRDAKNLLSPMIAGNPSDDLYLEHYDTDNLPVLLRKFLEQVKTVKGRKGKLIVIDGGDGSGKTVQSQLLVRYLEKHGFKVKYYDFPRYYTSFHGRIVGRFLAGEFGKLDDVSPYLASLAYALDRASAKEEMDLRLAAGGYIISNRYATSSMAHQGAKLATNLQGEFINWIDELEYKVHKIPRENIVIYLYVPWRIGMELTKQKGRRGYIGAGQDIAETDIRHRQESETMYLSLAKSRKNWVKIDCVEHGQILPKEVIHQKIISTLIERKIIA